MGKTKIEWTEATWNPILGCSKVSEGCRNCYAMSMGSRIANAALAKAEKGDEVSKVEKGYMAAMKRDPETGKFTAKWTGQMIPVLPRLTDPLRWQKPRMVFVNSMSDLFHPRVPDSFIQDVFAIMAITPRHTYQVLTKRAERMADFLTSNDNMKTIQSRALNEWANQDSAVIVDYEIEQLFPLKNVWLGTSVENQETANERIPYLMRCPAAVRFLSCEPLLGQVDLRNIPVFAGNVDALEPIHWVIAGGESGHNARPMHPDWVRSLRDQCSQANVAFFFKQWGAWQNGSDKNALADRIVLNTGAVNEVGEINVNELPPLRSDQWYAANPVRMSKVGKNKSGRLLDGEYYDEFPEMS